MNWWETEEGRKRLAVEKMMMNQTYPGYGKLTLDCERRLFWKMTFQIKFDDRIIDCIVQIFYPEKDYPAAAPRAYVIKPNVSESPHKYKEGNICLFHPRYKSHGWDPSSSTAVSIATWSIDWLLAHLTWKNTGRWPGKQHNQH